MAEFNSLDDRLKQIYYIFLNDRVEFSAFFDFIDYKPLNTNVNELIRDYFSMNLCTNIDYYSIFSENSISFCYCLSFINLNKKYSTISPWVLVNFPEVHNYLYLLKSNPCSKRCDYCKNNS